MGKEEKLRDEINGILEDLELLYTQYEIVKSKFKVRTERLLKLLPEKERDHWMDKFRDTEAHSKVTKPDAISRWEWKNMNSRR